MRPSILMLFAVSLAIAAPPDRLKNTIDARVAQPLQGQVHHLVQAQSDLGEVDPDMQLDHVQMLFTPSSAQQSDLDQLLKDQQNPSSPHYRQWLSPEDYANRFGLSTSDHSKVVAWLTSQGLTVNESSRGRNWVSFSGSAASVSKTFRTSFHRYQGNGRTHFANATSPSVPQALAGIVGGFIGLNDFPRRSSVVRPLPVSLPEFTSGKNHYLAPQDLATIYNISPLYTAGFDGTGQSIAIVGESNISLTDIRGFRTSFGLPANDPKILVAGTDPGFNANAQVEANLDVEWAGAIAPKATIVYVYAANVFNALSATISNNLAPVVSVSWGGCEIDDAPFAYRTIAQQANAQGMTILASSGDSGAAGCDAQGVGAFATRGRSNSFPDNLPEVTSVGGTMFDDATGDWWATRNSSTGGSALSYIPEVAWNESSVANGLLASGGGASRFFTKPDWQTGPGVPNDGARDTPDVSLSAAVHDGYLITYQGANSLYVVGGTSASTPSFAGIIALLNQYVVKQGFQKAAGLGNINPQMYRLAQAAPAAFHDIVSGDNIVPCSQGSPDCAAGQFGFKAGPGYDMATGLGSVDANVFVTSWNTPTRAAALTLTSSATKVTLNDTVILTATVAPGTGAGTPTGTVSFFASGIPLGTVILAPVGGVQTASVTVDTWKLPVSNATLYAQFAGDSTFSPASATVRVQVTLPTTANTSAVIPTITNPVYAVQAGQQATWHVYLTLRESAGVPAAVTALTVDGVAQALSDAFPSVNIPASGTLSGDFVLRNLTPPLTKTLGITGIDLSGKTWSRQLAVQFLGLPVTENFNVWVTPLTMQQNHAAPPSCQWSQQITLDELGGNALRVVFLELGSVNISNRIAAIFGTTRLAPYGSLSGTLCWPAAMPPANDQIFVNFQDEFGNTFGQAPNVSLAGPSPTPVTLSVSPASVVVKPSPIPNFQNTPAFTVTLPDKTQTWSAAVYPLNRTTTWLKLSQYSGAGSATVTVTANGDGFLPGVYRANVVIQSANSVPQWLTVPVMFVNSGSAAGPAISSVGNALSYTPGVSPGSLMAVYGSQFAITTQSAISLPLGLSLAGVSATVNGWPAPLLYASPTQLNVVVPYEAGAGPAVLGINNNGQIGGFQFRITPSAPGILADGSGNLLGSAAVKPGTYATLYVTGTGDINSLIPTGFGVSSATKVSALPVPLLPLGVSVGGSPALIQFAGVTPGVVGLVQVNFAVPSTVTAGSQPVVVTVNGVASAPASLTVTAAP